MINRGLSYIEDVPTDLLARLTASSRADSELSSKEESPGSLQATTEYEVISSSDIVIICVQTPLSKTREPDLSYVISAVDHIAEHLHSDDVEALAIAIVRAHVHHALQPQHRTDGGSSHTMLASTSPHACVARQYAQKAFRTSTCNPTNHRALPAAITDRMMSTAQITHR